MAQNYVQNGKNLAVVESLMTHPTHVDGLVDSGDPVLVGALVGVAANGAAESTDEITLFTEGVFNLSVAGFNAGDSTAVSFGDRLYISSSAVINKNASNTTFGIALDDVDSGDTAIIPVKVCGAGN